MYKTKVSRNFMKKIRTKFCWSHGTILGYLGTLLGALGYLDALKICFSPIIYYTMGINSRFYPIKSKLSDFFCASSQFCALNFSGEGKRGEDFFGI